MFLVSRRRPRIIRYFLFAVVIVPILDFLWSYHVFIASSVWNSGSLLQDHWIPSLLQVAGDLKAANISVFISIYENGSWDSTKSVLQQLKQTLEGKGIPHEIVIDDISHKEIIGKNASSVGWLSTAHGKEMRRIPYLATVRNEALKPLGSLTGSGTSFDKLVFINDVVFQKAADVMTLLNTRDGKYAAACALDFLNPPWNRVDTKTKGLHPPGMYDDFATRDSDGNIIASHLYPYFSSRLSSRAMRLGNDVPVQSCWNGIGSGVSTPGTFLIVDEYSCLSCRAIPRPDQALKIPRHTRLAGPASR
ncbi:MAG: hypothetical protein Q9210_005736 [Variospora velana]